jgi:serine phosphatase RsbU (regulator of sigma subunit)
VASIVGEALVSKSAYGDSLAQTRRRRTPSLAAELRWALLPPLTFTSDSVEVSGFLEPAYDIAGDTFDYAVNGDTLHVAVLDAMGHGLEASRMANLAVGEYRHCRRDGLSLGEMLERIDAVLLDQFGASRFVTGQLATLDLRSGALEVLNAGHPRPLHLRGHHDLGDLACEPCPPMGLGAVRTEVTTTALEPGDSLVLHTDGIIEARSTTGDEFGRDRLAELVSASLRRQDRPAEVIRQVVHAVGDHSGGPLRDDATVVLVRWLAERR